MVREETVLLFKNIVMSFDNFTASSEKVDYWTEALSDMPFDQARKNVLTYSKQNKFSPTLADVRNGYTRSYRYEDMTDAEREEWRA